MKITPQILLLLCLSLAVFLSPGFAATLPLNEPYGLAVDASGNLYVANSNANQILIYNSSYVQKSSISQNLDAPAGIAIYPYGNLWVANNGNSSITEYIHGKQNTSATITNAIARPINLAIDGLDNLWVQNGISNVTIYSPTSVYAPPSKLVQTITPPSGGVAAFTVGAGAFLYSERFADNLFLESASATLQGEPLNGGSFGLLTFALAPDDNGNIYVVNGTKVLKVLPNSTATNFATLPASATNVVGIAVDNAHGRVYISDEFTNRIFVYSTAGKLIHTIHN